MKKLFTLIFSVLFLGLSAQNALNFDGTDDYVQATVAGPSGNAARTIEAWIRTTVVSDPNSGGVQNVIVDWGAASPNGSRFTFCVLWNNSIRVEVAGNGISGTTAVNNGNWHHVAVTYDPLLSSNQCKLYIDGNLETQDNLTVAVNTATTIPVTIGQRVDNTRFFTGDIDEVRIWNEVRTQAQLQASMNSEFCSVPNNLVYYYKFNQGIAGGANTGVTTLLDVAGNNNGTLSNFSLSGTASNWVTGKSLTQGNLYDTIHPNTCGSYVSPSGSYTWTSSGVYNDTITNSTGCDSVYTINLTINNNSSSTIIETACGSYLSPSGLHNWTTSGTYNDTISNAVGCDSVITVNLTVVTVDTSVTRTGNLLTSNETGATYQWLDCNNGYSTVSGAVNQSFDPASNGSYAVEIEKNGCVDTSMCHNVLDVGMSDYRVNNRFTVWPNPVKDILYIGVNGELNDVIVDVSDLYGRNIKSVRVDWGKNTVNLSGLISGVYLIKISDGRIITTKKLIVR